MYPRNPARPRSARALALLAALAVAVAGCSSGDDAAPADPSTPATAPAPASTGPLPRYAGYTSTSYDDPSHWVCRPDREDICDSGLDATVVNADGTLTPEPFRPADDPPVDCFYVYPTISRDETATSDWDASPDEEGWVTVNQAARLQAGCRLFAPVYRQMTLKALSARFGGEAAAPSAEPADPYADVLDAFRTYMARDNGGRPFILVSHSQGSMLLQRLVAEEIDPHPDVREKLVVGFLAGWTLEVPEGADVGAQFKNVPLCRSEDQTGCVYAWSSWRSTTPPPPGAFYGKPRTPGTAAACNTPVTLADGRRAPLHAYFPSDARASILAGRGSTGTGDPWLDPAAGTITTPFVAVPGLVEGECRVHDGVHYLSVIVNGDPADPRADDIGGDLTPEWGLHLNDVNVVMGDLVDWVRTHGARAAGR